MKGIGMESMSTSMTLGLIKIEFGKFLTKQKRKSNPKKKKQISMQSN